MRSIDAYRLNGYNSDVSRTIGKENPMKKPNILWIITDQQSANMMGCSGSPYINTPNIDSIASAGVRFANAYCAQPVCAPSRFSLMTGLYPSAASVRGDKFHNSPAGLPEAVRKNGLGALLTRGGYNAVYGGKQNIPFTDCESLGFKLLCEDERDRLAGDMASYILNYHEDKPFAMIASFINPHDICYMAINDSLNFGCDDRDVKNILLNGKAETENCLKAQQLPPGMDEGAFFETACPPLPDNYQPAPDEPEAISILQEERPFKKLARQYYSDERWRIHRWAYKNLTEEADAQIGRVLGAVRQAGLWDNTVIIFTSDHGDMDASHKMEHKECLYQECCKVPLILKGAGAAAPMQTESAVVSNGLDIFPTVLDYAGIQAPYNLEGFSLKGRVQGGVRPPERECLVVECENGVMAVNDRYKYARYDRGERAEQFFDLWENPGEMYNQIGDGRYREIMKRLKAAADRHQLRSSNISDN